MALIGARSDTSSGTGAVAANERNRKKEQERKKQEKKDSKGKNNSGGGGGGGGGGVIRRRGTNRYNLKPEQETQSYSTSLSKLNAMGERKRQESAASNPDLPSDAGGSKLDSSGANDVQVEEKPGTKTETDDRDSKNIASAPQPTNTQKELFSGSSVTVDTENGTKVRRADRAVLPGTVTSDGKSVQVVDSETAKAIVEDPLTEGDAQNISETFEESPEYQPSQAFLSDEAYSVLGDDTNFTLSGLSTTLVEGDSSLPGMDGLSETSTTEETTETDLDPNAQTTDGPGAEETSTTPWWETAEPGTSGGGGGYGGALPTPGQSSSGSSSTRKLLIAGALGVAGVGAAWYMGWI